MKKCAFVLIVVALCLLLVSCSTEKQNEKGMVENSGATSDVSIDNSSETNTDDGNTEHSENTQGDYENSKFFGEWKANIITGYSDAGYEYGVENLTLNSDGQAVYKYFKGHWNFRKEENCIEMKGKITQDGISVDVEIIMQVLEKEGGYSSPS